MSFLLLMISLFPVEQVTSRPSVDKITPPDGGIVWYWSENMSFAVGQTWQWDMYVYTSMCRPFVWTKQTGTRYLYSFLTMPLDASVSGMKEYPDRYAITLTVYNKEMTGDQVYLIVLPKDINLWFSPADYDKDGDVDQTDFGLWQRNPKQMPLHDFLKEMTGVR